MDGSRPDRSRSRDLGTVVSGLWMIAGIFVDGWAHLNVASTSESFFTPSHAVIYSGFLAAAVWVAWPLMATWREPRRWRESLPAGYGLGLVGVAAFGLGGIADLAWHTGFGIEVSLEALLSPTHLLLLAGGLLTLTTPVRAAWHDPSSQAGWRDLGPTLLATALTVAVVSFFLAYAWGVLDTVPTEPIPAAALDEQAAGHFEAERLLSTGLLARLVTTAVLVSPLVLLARRWRLPVGTVTLVTGLVSLGMAGLFADQGLPILLPTVAALVAAVLADGLVATMRPGPNRAGAVRVLATAFPLLLWSGDLLALQLAEGLTWTVELWSGTIVLATASGYLLSLVAFPPPVPASA